MGEIAGITDNYPDGYVIRIQLSAMLIRQLTTILLFVFTAADSLSAGAPTWPHDTPEHNGMSRTALDAPTRHTTRSAYVA
jgi:hypothetical protein